MGKGLEFEAKFSGLKTYFDSLCDVENLIQALETLVSLFIKWEC